jgi:membrane-associated phospholipid phosphatase
MTKSNKKSFIIFSIVFYIIAIALMIIGSIKDLQIDMALFNPQSNFAITFETFGQFVYWGMWGPLFTVLFLTAHGLNECLDVIGKILPFVKPISNTDSKAYKVFDKIVKIVWQVVFFVLGVIGWKKLIENVLKKFFDIPALAYFGICIVVTIIGILVFSKINKRTLYKLEGLALAGVLLGIFYKIIENTKGITNRVRFREMVAATNGFYNEDGLSQGKLDGLSSRLTSDMANGTDFGAFTPWFKKGDDMGIYSHADSFPSGHTTYSCTLLLSSLFCNAFEKLKKIAPLMLLISFVYIALMGYSRMIAGAHYLTDVTGGAIIGYTLFLIVKAIYDKFYDKAILPTRKN